MSIWSERVREMHAKGIDVRREMSLRHASPKPSVFWDKLRTQGFRLGSARRLVIADSHRHAHELFHPEARREKDLSRVGLVSFDAHHDLFYSVKSLEDSVRRGRAKCDDWMFMVLARHVGLRALLVYPPWQGDREWNASMGRLGTARTKDLHDKIHEMLTPCVWPSPKVQEAAGIIDLAFICRSSAWSPPWHDHAFEDFVAEAERVLGVRATSTGRRLAPRNC